MARSVWLLTVAAKPMPLFSERLEMILAKPSNAPVGQLPGDGLVPVIAQDWQNGAVLMQAFANREALQLAVRSDLNAVGVLDQGVGVAEAYAAYRRDLDDFSVRVVAAEVEVVERQRLLEDGRIRLARQRHEH